ncbi:Fatty-acid amide hydrolase 2 [Armadillidium nasatum]|uniref:Fatty-acid amide hydrolase 2 n=1 Tax=Armadillidium nasatum TaxID=96803 RepID=A0A5N5TAU9_9CRUS|nr:Fatty-acid amide hydrolase 2 [Armadillidium nasatum]
MQGKKLLINSGKSEEELVEEKPLLGVPFTHTCGMWARRDHVADEDAECVRLMKEAGAINLGVTNVPELCMWWESSNSIYGRTCCAYDVNRIPGGSSGGEGSLQSACGTPLSIGSDIGGSIRLPSFFNGSLFKLYQKSTLTPKYGKAFCLRSYLQILFFRFFSLTRIRCEKVSVMEEKLKLNLYLFCL